MFCTQCGEKLSEDQKSCQSCGAPVITSTPKQMPGKVTSPWTLGRLSKYAIISVIAISIITARLFMGGMGLMDNDAVHSNDNGLKAMETGDFAGAAGHLENAADSAASAPVKMTTLTNLGYVYASDGKNVAALQSFKEALTYATENSSDYYLISGEINLLEGSPEEALQNYLEANKVLPDDFQINNALNLFYLDMNDEYPNYSDVKKALGYAMKAYQVTPNETKSTARENLAIAYYINEDYITAISYFKESEQNQPYIQLWLGMSYYALEDYTTAEPYLQKASDAGLTEANQFLETY